MVELEELNEWIGSNQNYFCLKTPDSKVVHVYGLTESSSSTPAESNIVVCPFESSIPIYWPVVKQWIIPLDSIGLLHFPPHSSVIKQPTDSGQEKYQSAVANAIEHILRGDFKKVVVAQTTTIKQESTELSEAFARTCDIPDSYSYLLNTSHDCWIGASPELFIKSDYKSCETVALAGTRLTSDSVERWGDKEIKEQSVVATFIVEAFKRLGFTDVKVGKQFTKSVGHMQHICNPVTASVPEHINWSNLMSSLHPTPALAGYPKEKALNFIQQSESFSRKLYGGFMGFIDDKAIELFVNIRCAQLFQNGAQLFAGAGINADSIPTKEWEETQNKLNVMRTILS